MRLAKKYWCVNRIPGHWQSSFHASGFGTPRTKGCRYCNGALVTEEGVHGVFKWSGGTGRYALADAIETFVSLPAAERRATAKPEDHLVVRWVTVEHANT